MQNGTLGEIPRIGKTFVKSRRRRRGPIPDWRLSTPDCTKKYVLIYMHMQTSQATSAIGVILRRPSMAKTDAVAQAVVQVVPVAGGAASAGQ